MSEPIVTFSLLNWNQTDFTLACLRSLARQDYSNHRVVLVDNGSDPESLKPIADEFPDITLIRNRHNIGFTGGNNQAIVRALADGADYVMLLNNDTEVAPDMLRLLLDFAEADPRIGIVGPLIYYYDAPDRIWFAGGLVDPDSAAARALGDGEVDDGSRGAAKIDYISGCALLIKREVVDKIGLIDDRMFIYYEEADWCARTREAGYDIWFVPTAKVWHKISMQVRGLSRRYIYLMTRNRLLYLRNRGTPARRIVWELCASDLRQAALWAILPRYRDRRPMAKYKLRGVTDFLRNRFGEPPFPR